MCKKTKGILKFFVICGVVIAAAAALIAIINKCKNKLPCRDDADGDDSDTEGGCCDSGCDECDLCDLDEDAGEEIEKVESAPSDEAEADKK